MAQAQGDFPPDVFLVARRPPPVAVPGGYQDAVGIETTVTVIGVRAIVPFASWKYGMAFVIVLAGLALGWFLTNQGTQLAWPLVVSAQVFCLYALWTSRDQSARIEVDWQSLDVARGRWPWRRRLQLALGDAQAFVAAEDGVRFRVVAEPPDASSLTLCRGIAQRQSADFVARTLEALRLRSASVTEASTEDAVDT